MRIFTPGFLPFSRRSTRRPRSAGVDRGHESGGAGAGDHRVVVECGHPTIVSAPLYLEGMRFTNSEFLWLAPLALVVAWWWSRRPRPALRFSDSSLFDGPRGGRAWCAVWGGAVLRGLACLALVLACAGPRRPDERTRLPADAIAMVMVVDVSYSMSER